MVNDFFRRPNPNALNFRLTLFKFVVEFVFETSLCFNVSSITGCCCPVVDVDVDVVVVDVVGFNDSLSFETSFSLSKLALADDDECSLDCCCCCCGCESSF